MRKLSAIFDIGDRHRQDLENDDEDSAENKGAIEGDLEMSGFEKGEQREDNEGEEKEEEEDYYEMVEPPDGQYFEAVNEIYAEIGGGGYKRDLSSIASSTSDSSSEEGNAIVTAKPAIVLEDQIDSLSYVGYDDIAGNVKSGLSRGGLYEDIAGSLLNLARMKSGGEDIAKAVDAEATENPDEMLSYTLAKLSEASNHNSAADSGDKSSDEWVDLDDDEEEETDDYDAAERLVRNKGLVR